MSFANKFVQIAKRILPSPFTIAVLLTGFTFLLALFLTESKADSDLPHALQIMEHWEKGFWELLNFAMQMMLMLVLGHVLALSKVVNQLINASIRFCKDTASAAFFVTLLTITVSLINWGLGLIFGAIFARKVGVYASQKGFKFIVITNQAGISRGMIKKQDLDFMHIKMKEVFQQSGINILDVYVCPHHWDDNCYWNTCR